MSEENKEIVEDITAEVVESGTADASLEHAEPKGALVGADEAFKTTAKDMRQDAKDAMKKAMYSKAAPRERRKDAEIGELQSKLIGINRITKVVKGGRTLRFNAVVIVGDKQGKVAIGSGKAREVTEAIRKAEQDAKKQFKSVPIVGTTIPHEVIGRFGTSKVKMMPSKEGNGLVAGISVRAVLELAGYKDVTAKCYGSTNSTNVVKATLQGLLQLKTREEIAFLRGKESL